MRTELFDVIIVGRGPVGLVMAATMAGAGHRIALVERHRDLYGLPRAGHVDHEIMRVLQSLGAADAVLADSYPTTEYVWKNATGETLLEFDWRAPGISGYNSDYMQFQPIMERALSDRVAGSAGVVEYLGWSATGFTQDDAAVDVTLEGADGASATLRGRYLIGADGAGSIIRRLCGIERDDLGFNERWLVLDVRKRREITFGFDCGQICDPRRPITVLPLGKRHRRWEWAMLPGETREELEAPETAWRLLAEWGVTPDDAEIVRQLVYTFEARLAQSWRRGCVFLMGDACHTMPPFMGQGMCSGIRDAKNLAWKLDLVLRNAADAAILDSYEVEREPHARAWTVISLEAGKVPCTLDPEVARQRDAMFRNGWLPPMPDFPKLGTGLLQSGPARTTNARAGELGLQGRVVVEGRADLFDNHFPRHGFTIISTVADPRSVLDDRQVRALERIGTTLAFVAGTESADHPFDVDGTYADYFARHGIEAAINRPDFYVFGAVPRLADLPSLVDDLLRQLGVPDDRAATVPAVRAVHAPVG